MLQTRTLKRPTAVEIDKRLPKERCARFGSHARIHIGGDSAGIRSSGSLVCGCGVINRAHLNLVLGVPSAGIDGDQPAKVLCETERDPITMTRSTRSMPPDMTVPYFSTPLPLN
jgi:hypothetical protein